MLLHGLALHLWVSGLRFWNTRTLGGKGTTKKKGNTAWKLLFSLAFTVLRRDNDALGFYEVVHRVQS